MKGIDFNMKAKELNEKWNELALFAICQRFASEKKSLDITQAAKDTREKRKSFLKAIDNEYVTISHEINLSENYDSNVLLIDNKSKHEDLLPVINHLIFNYQHISKPERQLRILFKQQGISLTSYIKTALRETLTHSSLYWRGSTALKKFIVLNELTQKEEVFSSAESFYDEFYINGRGAKLSFEISKQEEVKNISFNQKKNFNEITSELKSYLNEEEKTLVFNFNSYVEAGEHFMFARPMETFLKADPYDATVLIDFGYEDSYWHSTLPENNAILVKLHDIFEHGFVVKKSSLIDIDGEVISQKYKLVNK